jgi:hypothetical protein
VITPTIRLSGIRLIEKALKRQTFTDFEWIIGAPFSTEIKATWVKDDFQDGYWSLNRIYNSMIRKAKGELIVSWQDFTSANPDCLEKFWTDYQETKGIIGAVGNKYKDETWVEKVWQDPRERNDQGTFYICTPQDIEGNLAAYPRKALYDIGGFDEGADFLYYGMDCFGVNERLDKFGYVTYLDQTIKSYSISHGRPKGWDEHNGLNGDYQAHKLDLIDKSMYPVLKYLV